MLSSEMQALLEHYNHGLSLYKNRQFAEAKSEFQKGLEYIPEDGPSQIYIERCNLFMENPPPDDWDGVFTMTTK